MKKVEIPYIPRKAWAEVIHPALDRYRYALLVAHRRFGKTIGMGNQLVKEALMNDKEMPKYAYVAPYLKQAKRIAWEPLKKITRVIPGVKVNNQELYIELPSRHAGLPGARIYIIGGDNPDGLVGDYWDGVVFDEYELIKPELYYLVRPALADRPGNVYIIGTPRGENHFFDMYCYAKNHTDKWFVYKATAEESGVLPEEELAELREQMPELMYRQEMLCDFGAAVFNAVMSPEQINVSTERILKEEDVAGQPVVLGVDIARYGDDRTSITARKGLLMYDPEIYQGLNTMEVVDRVIVAIAKFKPAMVFIDVGAMGAGVIDRLRQLGYDNIVEVAFGGKALDFKRYENLRAEMYFKMRDWMEAGGRLPDNADMRKELGAVEYFISKNSRLQLESKSDLKSKIGASPDVADSAVLTFAKPVYNYGDDAKMTAQRKRLRERNEYDPFRDLWIK